MANNNYKFKSSAQPSWISRNILLSLSLYFSTYIVFGWLIASKVVLWADFLRQQNIPIEILLEEELLFSSIKLLALVTTIVITFLLSTPIALTTFLFRNSIHSDLKGFLSILLWSIFLVFAFCSFDFLADLLVLISVNILLRIDLRKLKYRNWQIILTTVFCAAIAFSSGIILFDLFSHH